MSNLLKMLINHLHPRSFSLLNWDASGKNMAVYDKAGVLKEMPIYDNQRIGMIKAHLLLLQRLPSPKAYKYSSTSTAIAKYLPEINSYSLHNGVR